MGADTSPTHQRPGPRGQLAWNVPLNSILILAFGLGAIPMVAIARGFIDLVSQSRVRSGADWVAYGFAFTGLFLGAVFFAYAIKYYLSMAMVLLTTLVGGSPTEMVRSSSPGSLGSGLLPTAGFSVRCSR